MERVISKRVHVDAALFSPLKGYGHGDFAVFWSLAQLFDKELFF